jgi:hypothetical protein
MRRILVGLAGLSICVPAAGLEYGWETTTCIVVLGVVLGLTTLPKQQTETPPSGKPSPSFVGLGEGEGRTYSSYQQTSRSVVMAGRRAAKQVSTTVQTFGGTRT